ncbi:MAG: V-type ATP synthase subunit E [Candidatus Thermoplasmatota archaeon]|nr:V-type ATP synthase subunit E [Candidatus Thermoplasmatota archaeon]
MTLERLVQQIEKDAENESHQIIEEAKKEAEKIIGEAKKRAKKEAEAIAKKGEKEASRLKEKILASARRKARGMEMRAKEEVMQVCIQKAMDMLKKVGGKKYEAAIKRFMGEGKELLGDCVVIISREQDKKITRAMGLKTDGNVSSIGGIIVRSTDGSTEIDNTFESIMERKTGEIRIMIANELFPGKE